MLCMHHSGSHNSNAAHDNAGINNEGDDDDDVEQFFLFVFHVPQPYKAWGGRVWGGFLFWDTGKKSSLKMFREESEESEGSVCSHDKLE